MRVVDGRVAVGHFDLSPAFEGSEHHEEVSDAVALIFIVVRAGLAAATWRDFSRASGSASRKVCMGVFPKHHLP